MHTDYHVQVTLLVIRSRWVEQAGRHPPYGPSYGVHMQAAVAVNSSYLSAYATELDMHKVSALRSVD